MSEAEPAWICALLGKAAGTAGGDCGSCLDQQHGHTKAVRHQRRADSYCRRKSSVRHALQFWRLYAVMELMRNGD